MKKGPEYWRQKLSEEVIIAAVVTALFSILAALFPLKRFIEVIDDYVIVKSITTLFILAYLVRVLYNKYRKAKNVKIPFLLKDSILVKNFLLIIFITCTIIIAISIIVIVSYIYPSLSGVNIGEKTFDIAPENVQDTQTTPVENSEKKKIFVAVDDSRSVLDYYSRVKLFSSLREAENKWIEQLTSHIDGEILSNLRKGDVLALYKFTEKAEPMSYQGTTFDSVPIDRALDSLLTNELSQILDSQLEYSGEVYTLTHTPLVRAVPFFHEMDSSFTKYFFMYSDYESRSQGGVNKILQIKNYLNIGQSICRIRWGSGCIFIRRPRSLVLLLFVSEISPLN